MAQQLINVGPRPNSGAGDALRDALIKVNENFTEVYAEITALKDGNVVTDIKGNVFGEDSALLVDGVNSSINLNGTVKGDIIPDTDVAYDLGSSTKRFRDLYLSGSTIDLGGTTLSIVGGELQLGGIKVPTQADVAASIANAVSAPTGDLTGSVFADDSTLLVDGVNGTIPAANLSGALPAIDGSALLNLPGSNPFDQDLNTTDNPQFNRVGLTAGEINVVPGTDFNLYVTPDGVTSHNLNFGTDGTLTTPALNVTGRLTAFNIQPVDAVPGEQAVNSYIRAQTATTPFAGSFPGGNLYLEAGLSYAGNIAGNIYIGTTETSAVTIGSGSVTVTSDLLLGPASTAAPVLSTTVNGQNGIAMDLRIDAGTDSGVTGNVTISGDTVNLQGTVDLSNASIVGDIRSEGNINIDINLSDSTLRRWSFGEDGNLNLARNLQFPNGAEIRDVNGDLRLRAAPGDVAQLQGLTTDGAVDAAVKAFHDIETGSYVTINTNIDAGAPEHVWTFDYNGDLTFPDDTVQSTAYQESLTEFQIDATTVSTTGLNGANTIIITPAIGYSGSDTQSLGFTGRDVAGRRTLVINASSLCNLNIDFGNMMGPLTVAPSTVVEVIYTGNDWFTISTNSI